MSRLPKRRAVDNTILFTLPEDAQASELFEWWMHTSFEDFVATVPKMLEYGGGGQGSADLQVMGDAQAELIGMHSAPDAVKQELGVWFYTLGKVSRLISDYKNQRSGKADTWFDISIYAKMARRIQEVGRWP
jgi:hypothetical protein